jgi:hypothetical protein
LDRAYESYFIKKKKVGYCAIISSRQTEKFWQLFWEFAERNFQDNSRFCIPKEDS